MIILNFTDSSGNGYTYTNNNVSFNNTVNKKGTHCAYFNGATPSSLTSNQSINLGATSAVSFVCWFRFDDAANYAKIFSFINVPAGVVTNGCYLGRNGTTNNLQFRVYNGTTSINSYITNFTITTGVMYHMCFVHLSTGVQKAYINGALTQSFSGSWVMDNVSTIWNYVGKSSYTGDGKFSGYIDDFRVYNREITLSEVQQIIIHIH